MNSTIDMKAVEAVASSPDARVRNVAQRRLEIEQEIGPLDAFLGYYINEAATIASPVSSPPKVASKAKPKANSRASDKGKTLRMIDAARTIMVDNGKPMPIDALYVGMKERYADLCPTNAASMRARITEHKDKISRIDGRGYWPNDVPAPALDA